MAQHPDNSNRRRFLAAGGTTLAAGGLSHMLPRDLAAAPAAPQASSLIQATPWTSNNPFLTRAFAPVFDERTDNTLAVRGEIPGHLRGVFLRNGPNPLFEPDAHYSYPFDGMGMIHAIYLDNGQAQYRNRWVATREFADERAAGHRVYNTNFSPPPHANLANTNIIHHGGRYLALYEDGVPYELTRDLATVGPFNYEGRLPRVMSAHPKLDPATGELLAIAYDLETGALTYLRADPAGRLDRSVGFQAPWPAMVHDIIMTESHVLAIACPLVWDFKRQGPPAVWEPDRGAMIALIPRDAQSADDVKWLQGPPFFNWHAVNGYIQDGRAEIVLPWYDAFHLGAPAKRLELHRLVIDLDAGKVEDQTLDDRPCEFGRVNDAYLGRKARYGYVGLRDPRPGEQPQMGAFESIARYDLATGEKIVHRFPAGSTVCEPVFVPADNPRDETDGYVFTFVHDAGQEGGRFLILDAQNLAAEPIAEIGLPRRVPAGLHGSWVSL